MRWGTKYRKPTRPADALWHQWYAWRPVRCKDIGGTEWTYTRWIWLETIYRKIDYSHHSYVKNGEIRERWTKLGEQRAFLPGPDEETP